MPVNNTETCEPSTRGLQYSLRELLLFFLAITLLISGYATACSGVFYESDSLFIVRASPVIIGVIVYFIGTFNRRGMHYPRFTLDTRIVLVMIISMSTIILGYLLWARTRMSYGIANYFDPKDWPYPDKAIMKLDDWLNVHYAIGPARTIYSNNGMPIYSGPVRLEDLEGLGVGTATAPPMREFFRHAMFTLEILMGPFIVIAACCLGFLAPFRLRWLGESKSAQECFPRRK
jgi:hypothetical protein